MDQLPVRPRCFLGWRLEAAVLGAEQELVPRTFHKRDEGNGRDLLATAFARACSKRLRSYMVAYKALNQEVALDGHDTVGHSVDSAGDSDQA
jgi:hypothetical protein